MTASVSNSARQPIWVTALIASTRGGDAHSSVDYRLRWESGRAALRVTNSGAVPVFVSSLGIELHAGAKVDVHWPAGATSFEVRAKRAA